MTEKDLEDLKKMGVYEDVEELPVGKKAIGCCWVYEFKINESGGPPTYKVWLVAQGFLQVSFVDYNVTFAPVAKSVMVHFIAVYSALQGWHLQCFDATCAFLHGGLVRALHVSSSSFTTWPLASAKVHIRVEAGKPSLVSSPLQGAGNIRIYPFRVRPCPLPLQWDMGIFPSSLPTHRPR